MTPSASGWPTRLRNGGALSLILFGLGATGTVEAQGLATVCRAVSTPTVGQWAAYRLSVGSADRVTGLRSAITGDERINGTTFVWQQITTTGDVGEVAVRMLVPGDPYRPTDIRRAIVQLPGQEPLELPPHLVAQFGAEHGTGAAPDPMETCREGHALDWEMVTVPAGTFRALRVRHVRDGRTADTWLVPGIPFGQVRTIVSGASPAERAEVVLTTYGQDPPARPVPRRP
ncbi:MAG: hypothetical protein OER21_00770 [Gemmatimonadota bacterium]|nr:hypothetical protein [Gemmatimonadota bacterium]